MVTTEASTPSKVALAIETKAIGTRIEAMTRPTEIAITLLVSSDI